MKTNSIIVFGLALVMACAKDNSTAVVSDKSTDLAWIDTVRFNTKLTPEQRQAVFYKRNFEEDYRIIDDTTRIALRFFWWRSFHPYVTIRLENRPGRSTNDSTSQVRVYDEWFALYKENIQDINDDCPVWKRGRCYGKVMPYVHRQGVEVMPVNQTPALLLALDSIGFWNMKPTEVADSHTDGSSWTLQVYYRGKYHEVTTDIDNHPIKSICLQMVKLSKYPVKAKEIY